MKKAAVKVAFKMSVHKKYFRLAFDDDAKHQVQQDLRPWAT